MSAAAPTKTVAQYLTFTLDGGLFAIDIERTREVLQFTGATKVPKTPEFMRGVLNLRGHVVPVIDLRLRFGMPRTETTIDTRVVILDMEVDGVATTLGALADSVQEVIDLASDQLSPPPRIGTRINSEFIRGVGRRDERLLMILDIDRVLTMDELAVVAASATEETATTTAATSVNEEGAPQ